MLYLRLWLYMDIAVIPKASFEVIPGMVEI